MNTRCRISAIVAAFSLMFAALVLAPSAAQAQAVDCSQCDHFTFAVAANMSCSVTICYSSPAGVIICQSVNPGTNVRIPCQVNQAWVNTCSGNYYIIPAVAAVLCSPDLKFAAGCCGHICIVPSIDVCTRIEAQPVPCLTRSCP